MRLSAAPTSFWVSFFWAFRLAAAEPQESTLSPADVMGLSLTDLVEVEVRVPTVTGASKRAELTIDAPNFITDVSSKEIASYGYRTLADILASVPGFYVTYDRSYHYLGVRGFNRGIDNSRVLILVNGHRINNNLSDGGAIGTDFILDVDLIDHVEVIRGPGSVLYGNNAFFGVVNVVTKRGRDYPGYGAEISGEAASFDTYKGRVTFGHKFTNEVELLFSGSYYNSVGRRPLFIKGIGTASRGDDDHSKEAFALLSYRDFSLEGAFITREKGDPTAPQGTVFNDSRTRHTDEREYVNLKYQREFPDVVDISAQVYFDRYQFHNSFMLDPVGLNKDWQRGEWWGTDVQLSKALLEERLRLTLGGEYRDDFNQERHNFFPDQPIGAGRIDLHRSTRNYGVYFQEDFQIVRTNLHFHAGVRYDQYADFDPTANPRLALIYHPFRKEPDKTTFKAIYGTAFRAPNFYELSLNGDLEPETIRTYELVYEQRIGAHLWASIAGFHNQIDKLIEQQDDGSYVNKDGADADGAEVALEAVWTGGVRARASYSYVETKDRDTHELLTDSPRHLGKVNLTVPLWGERLSAGIEARFTSKRRTAFALPNPDPNVGGIITARGSDAAGYGIVNVTLLSQNLVKNLDLSVSVYNLLDHRFYDPATPFHGQDLIEQEGRVFRVKLTYRF